MNRFLLVSAQALFLLGLIGCTSTSPVQEKIVAKVFNQTSLPEVWQSNKA
jgi:hypothetical protein